MSELLWAPWRMHFLQRPKPTGCVFCGLLDPAATTSDRERLILWRGANTFCVMNLYPYNPGHLMVIPYQHASTLKALNRETQQEMIWLLSESIEIQRTVLQAEGMNCGANIGAAGGAGIPDHVHLHTVPRWHGDTNFLPILGRTKALPEYLDETYEKLLPAFQQLAR